MMLVINVTMAMTTAVAVVTNTCFSMIYSFFFLMHIW